MDTLDTTKLIFEEKFLTIVPTIAVRSEEEIRLFGSYLPEGMTPQEVMDHDVTKVMLTIAEIATIYQKGFPVRVPNKEDFVKIYDNISRHLHAWDMHLKTSVNTLNPPVDDLLLLDELAEKVFKVNKPELTKPPISNFTKHINNKFGFAGENPFSLEIDKKTKLESVERESMADRFKTRVTIQDIDFGNISN